MYGDTTLRDPARVRSLLTGNIMVPCLYTENQPTQCSSNRGNRRISDRADCRLPTRREDTAMAGKIAALLDTLTFPDVEALAPTERRRFAERCRFWAHFSERTRIEPQGSGVLAELGCGYRVD